MRYMRRLLVAIKNIVRLPYRILCTHISVFAILQDSKVDRNAAICKGARFYRSSIEKYSYIGYNTFITNTNIGAFTSVSGNCYIGGTSHPLNWVSTSSVFHKWDNILHKNFAKFEYDIFNKTYIGNDVWIGEGCKVKAGIKISDGAVIGMGSVVTKDVGPYEIWAGSPARFIRTRLEEDIIKELLKIQWWEWEDEKITQYADLYNNPNEFISIVNKREINED